MYVNITCAIQLTMVFLCGCYNKNTTDHAKII